MLTHTKKGEVISKINCSATKEKKLNARTTNDFDDYKGKKRSRGSRKKCRLRGRMSRSKRRGTNGSRRILIICISPFPSFAAAS